jgi:uncharacterized protein (DUF1684 family)
MKFAAGLLLAGLFGPIAKSTPDPAYQTFVAQQRAARANVISAPEGWLSLVALEWLKPGDTTVGSAAGENVHLEHAPAHLLTLHTGASGEISLASIAPGVTVNGQPPTAGPLPGRESAAEIRQGSLLLTIIKRGDRKYLRVKDAYAPGRVRFRGLIWYPVDPKLHVIAKWIPATTPTTITIPNVLGQVSQDPSPGIAEFTLEGQSIRLAPIQEDRNSLFFIFRDTTSRTTTYGAGRFLTTPLPSNGLTNPGTVDMDFNLAVNPPCAFTPYATCPLPPEQNRLNIAIAGGEKRYNP